MKRISALLVIVLTLCLICACSKQSEKPSDDTDAPIVLVGDENTFKLSRLPDIGKYSPETAPKRWYKEFTDHLIPSSEYGELIPFIGNVKSYEYENWYVEEGEDATSYMNLPLYGLCTKDGTIVVDAVYTNIMYNDGYYALQTLADEKEQTYSYYIAKSDGSEVTKLPVTSININYFDDGIYGFGVAEVESICDRQGNLLIDRERMWGYRPDGSYGYVNVLSDGTFVEHISNDTIDSTEYLIDKKLNKISDDYYSIDFATKGKYIAKSLESGLYGIIDKNGEIIIPTNYDDIEYQNGIYAFLKNNNIEVKNEKLETLSSFTVSYDINRIKIEGDKVIEVFTDDSYIVDSCYDLKGNILDYDGVDGQFWNEPYYYTAIKGNTKYVFDADFKLLTEIDEKYNVMYFGNNKLILYDSDSETYEESIFDIKENKFVEDEIETYYSGYEFYYKTDENGKTYAYKTATLEKLFEVTGYIYSLDTLSGKMYFYKSGDYCYTANENLETILKIRTEND